MNSLTEQKRRLIVMGLNIAIIIFAVVLAGSLCYVIKQFANMSSIIYSEDSFYYYLREERYASMVDGYYVNLQNKEKAGKKLAECYGIAKYYNAAFFYHAYEETGDMEGMQRMEAQKEQAYAEMGNYTSLADKIDSMH